LELVDTNENEVAPVISGSCDQVTCCDDIFQVLGKNQNTSVNVQNVNSQTISVVFKIQTSKAYYIPAILVSFYLL